VPSCFVLQIGQRGVAGWIAGVERGPVDAGEHVVPLGSGLDSDVSEARLFENGSPCSVAKAMRESGVLRVAGLPIGEDQPASWAEDPRSFCGCRRGLGGKVHCVDADRSVRRGVR
jgi:hypothetical protein